MRQKTVLFICTQNCFRSPSGEAFLKSLVAEKNDDSITVTSAGTYANDPYGMYKETRNRILFHGGDLEEYYQKKLSQRLVDEADVIVCMTWAHKHFVERNFKKDAYLFNELTIGEKTDLEDDDEAHGTYDSLPNFIIQTVDTIFHRMPQLYETIKSMD